MAYSAEPERVTTPLRVVMVVPTYLPESFGGAEQQCRKLCRALDELGVDVTILAPRLHASTARREVHGRTRIERIRVRQAPNLGGRHMASFLRWSAQVAWWLFAQRRHYDVVHVVHGRLHAVPAAVAGRVLGKPTVIKLGRGGAHFDLKIVREKRLGGPLFWRLMSRLPTAFIANSREIVADLQAHDISDARIIQLPNGVEIPPASSRRRDRPFGEPEVRFLYIGRLDPEKALDRMIAGFARLGAGTRARLTLVGDGECGSQLRSLVQDLGIADRVAIRPPVADVGPLLHDADFHVSTSLSEGMSNALLESMSWGTPAIVSKVSGVEDIVADGVSGLVFEPGDDEGYVAALRRAMSMTADDWRAMSGQAVERMWRGFAIESVAEQHLAIYRGLLQSASTTAAAVLT
jgi:glycosyltransferase involved in cell wall biosynthesis